ncbi:putative glutamate carboxypeptidase [Neolecta irregularis DAH-3]|uniref:Putative glutamate carboxypeptidase n=1 Tax=Neolecta irregularis (strain DAH-3) TaxID=1198029 RepID=A0A1U7LW01_NEOID|nr:putative glutamate carboxypeptidase [Neolecta irregularis DAH-3]|eukprot:OLL26814.1 putative glutamate carboxypeptidase [Neolecta irregularis DAH-3]
MNLFSSKLHRYHSLNQRFSVSARRNRRILSLLIVCGMSSLLFLILLKLTNDVSPLKLPQHTIEEIMTTTPNNITIKEWSHFYASGLHSTGQNKPLAEWTMKKWIEYGIEDTKIEEYRVYMNSPVSQRLALLDSSGAVAYEAKLMEDIIPEDESSKLQNAVPTYHGYSANGNVTGHLLYVNHCQISDFRKLAAEGIEIANKIILCRYGKVFRGLKIRHAQLFNASAVLMYSDPADDRGISVAHGYEEYPNGPARQHSSVERGGAQFLSFVAGDPTTPGYPSKEDSKRMDPQSVIPSIPSLPISYENALPFLKALNGKGMRFDEWKGELDATYNVGPSDVEVNLVNQVTYGIQSVWNVIGTIHGSIENEVVILGNHRDAWVYGAGDPVSGSAALMEVARSFGELLQHEWTPHRTITLASWDGEEFGLLGSTEWVEDHADFLRENAVAYLNVDIAAIGPHFKASSSPLLYSLLRDVAKDISVSKDESVFDQWQTWNNCSIKDLGSGSDYTSFMDHIGITSCDINFGYGTAIHPYHSTYDSSYWMEKFGDPNYVSHTLTAKIWGLVAIRLSEAAVIPFVATDYAYKLTDYFDKLVSALGENPSVSLDKLHNSIVLLHENAAMLDANATLARKLATYVSGKKTYGQHIQTINSKFKLFERGFIGEGNPQREWFKHVVYAPGIYTGYGSQTFPSITEAIDEKDWKLAQIWADKVAQIITNAALAIDLGEFDIEAGHF